MEATAVFRCRPNYCTSTTVCKMKSTPQMCALSFCASMQYAKLILLAHVLSIQQQKVKKAPLVCVSQK